MMKVRIGITACACALTCQLALALDGPEPPHPAPKATPLVVGHNKASSMAPGPHVKHASYGAPLDPPILKRRKPARKQPQLHSTALPPKPGK